MCFFCKTFIFPGIFPASSKGCWKWKLEQERKGVFGRARQRLQVLRHFKGLSLVIIEYILWFRQDNSLWRDSRENSPTRLFQGWFHFNATINKNSKGRGSGGKEMTNKLKLCAAYLLHQLGKDHNTWSQSVKKGCDHVEINCRFIARITHILAMPTRYVDW